MVMNRLPIYIVDAFASRQFEGNPAAVVLLEAWLNDSALKAIAAENNLSETAFLCGDHIRWFTPLIEVGLCGHATLATAFVLNKIGNDSFKKHVFQSSAGALTVHREGNSFIMDFPVKRPVSVPIPSCAIASALGVAPVEILASDDRYICFYESEGEVRTLTPDLGRVKSLPLPGVIITSAGTSDVDFVSRYFAPRKGVPEDPVTGTSHCLLAPIWGQRLGKKKLKGQQLSARGGFIECELVDEQVRLCGQARLYSSGFIHLE